MTKDDLKAVTEVLQHEKLDILNTRAFKQNDEILITIGSIEKHSRKVEHKGRKFEIRYGEFSDYLKDMVFYLEKALPYCANDH